MVISPSLVSNCLVLSFRFECCRRYFPQTKHSAGNKLGDLKFSSTKAESLPLDPTLSDLLTGVTVAVDDSEACFDERINVNLKRLKHIIRVFSLNMKSYNRPFY